MEDDPKSYSVESEIKIVEALFPPQSMSLDPSPKRIALCFSLLQKLLARTSKGYKLLSDRLMVEVLNAIYVHDSNKSGLLSRNENHTTPTNLMSQKQAYFQIVDQRKYLFLFP